MVLVGQNETSGTTCHRESLGNGGRTGEKNGEILHDTQYTILRGERRSVSSMDLTIGASQ